MSQSEAVHAYALENHDQRALAHRSVPLLTRGCYGSVNAGRGTPILPGSKLCISRKAPSWSCSNGTRRRPQVLPGMKRTPPVAHLAPDASTTTSHAMRVPWRLRASPALHPGTHLPPEQVPSALPALLAERLLDTLSNLAYLHWARWWRSPFGQLPICAPAGSLAGSEYPQCTSSGHHAAPGSLLQTLQRCWRSFL